MKKHITILGLIILWLGGCWLIGHQRNIRNYSDNIETESLQNDFLNYERDLLSNISFEGNRETTDNPWNMTAGKFEMEGEGSCIFLTPNTAVIFDGIEQLTSFSFRYEIHPWVRESSDGAGFLVWVLDGENSVLYQEEILVSSEEEWNEYQINLENYQNVEKVKVLCNNGVNNNDNADWLILKSVESPIAEVRNSEGATEKMTYVKAAHYFSDSWPIDFWNSELDHLEEELDQIKQDGFNTLVLVIPWREFQPETNPIQYNSYPFEKLQQICQVACEKDLYIIVRIGYTWDYYNDENENIIDRYYSLMYDEKIQLAWLEYVKEIYHRLSEYEKFLGGFICWEDFWNNVYIAKNATIENRIKLANEMGYQRYIEKNYTIEEINLIYGEQFLTYSDIYIPDDEKEEFRLFYDFFDDYLNNLLYQTQNVFPNLSMEVRVDADLVVRGERYEYYNHNKTYECKGSDFVTIMYGIPMGFENKGELVSAEDAASKTDMILGNVNQVTGNKKLFVDQFLFVDNTPEFFYNAQVKSDELSEYLDFVSAVLVDQTWGYGVWTYKDYCTNILYNSEFLLDTNGWIIEGNAEIQKIENSKMLYLYSGAKIQQAIPISRYRRGSEVHVEFDLINVNKEENGKVILSLGEEMELSITKDGRYSCVFENKEYHSFSLQTDTDIVIDNMKVYTHVQEGELYTLEGAEDSCIASIRNMNHKIDHLVGTK